MIAVDRNRELELVEVGPRDGLQDHNQMVSTEHKVEMVLRARQMGVHRVEITSFANPKQVPQMADAEAVVAAFDGELAGLSALVLNDRSVERALIAGVADLNCVVVATDTFSERNQRLTTAEAMEFACRACDVGPGSTTVTIAAAFGCPFEGAVPAQRVIDLVTAAQEYGATEIALADTIGCGTPAQVRDLCRATLEVAEVPLRLHLHNSRNTGYANAWAAYSEGIRIFDTSIAGLGGCPFAPGASGNLATEEMVYLFGSDAGRYDLDRSIDTAHWASDLLSGDVNSMILRAEPFPPRST